MARLRSLQSWEVSECTKNKNLGPQILRSPAHFWGLIIIQTKCYVCRSFPWPQRGTCSSWTVEVMWPHNWILYLANWPCMQDLRSLGQPPPWPKRGSWWYPDLVLATMGRSIDPIIGLFLANSPYMVNFSSLGSPHGLDCGTRLVPGHVGQQLFCQGRA